MNLRDALAQATKTNDELYSIPATVTKVDQDKGTCTVEPVDGSPQIFGVRLQAKKGKGFLAIPKVGSDVIVTFLSPQEAYLGQPSDVKLFVLETENESLKKILADMLTAIGQMTVTTSTGPSGTPVNVADFQQIKTRLDDLFLR